MNSVKNNKMADLAWDKLHDRLERDGLLDDNVVKRDATLFTGKFVLSLAASLVLIAARQFTFCRISPDQRGR